MFLYCDLIYCFVFFFFSSRRRHTRFDCDWSSDVCSSDLPDGVKTTDLFLPGTVPTFAETPTSTSGDGNTPDQGRGGSPSQPLPNAYCPASYNFAFPPPPDNQVVVDAGWW